MGLLAEQPLDAWVHTPFPDFWRAENGGPCTLKTAHLYIGLGSGLGAGLGLRVRFRVSDGVRVRVAVSDRVRVRVSGMYQGWGQGPC